MMLHRLSAAAELLHANSRYRRYALARLSSTIGSTVAPLGLAFAILQSGGGAAELGLRVDGRPARLHRRHPGCWGDG